MTQLCALCRTNSDLKNSHIIPEFFFKPLYDSIHRFHVLPSDPAKREKHEQKGFREFLLCGTCEIKLGRWEDYAKRAFVDAEGVQITTVKNRIIFRDLDYRRFKLFQISLLWRMGVSGLSFFEDVDLGPHGEKLRTALLNEDPLEPNEYPCILTAVKIDGRHYPDLMLPPSLIKWEGHHIYRVLINSICFMFFVGTHPPPAAINFVVLNKGNEMAITIEEVRNIPFLSEAILKVSIARGIRKKAK